MEYFILENITVRYPFIGIFEAIVLQNQLYCFFVTCSFFINFSLILPSSTSMVPLASDLSLLFPALWTYCFCSWLNNFNKPHKFFIYANTKGTATSCIEKKMKKTANFYSLDIFSICMHVDFQLKPHCTIWYLHMIWIIHSHTHNAELFDKILPLAADVFMHFSYWSWCL